MRIALFVTCLADTFTPETGRATVEVLERLGHEVVFPPDQTCCGQMHANSGYHDDAVALVRRFERSFDAFEAIVSPSSSCVGHLREFTPTLAPRVFELSELLVSQLGVEDVDASFPARVTYHATCHSLRVTRVGDAPLRLLRHVRGLELVELERSNECCGFGEHSPSRTRRPRRRSLPTSALRSRRAARSTARRSTVPACSTSAVHSHAGSRQRA